MNFIKLFLFFFAYSILGYFCEVVYISLYIKKFKNTGFLFGPYLPIYGFGAIFVVALLKPFQNYWYLVFILGIAITTALEYFTSLILEKVFQKRWWDYSSKIYLILSEKFA
jgi:uncharacterized membrane protein